VAIDPLGLVDSNLTTWFINQKSNMSRGNQPELARILKGNVHVVHWFGKPFVGRKHSEMVSGVEAF
jgi:hypothetical protein